MQALITQYYIALCVDITTKLFTLDTSNCPFFSNSATDILMLLENSICLGDDKCVGN